MKPLAGLRIIDLTRLLPGPAATMHLADFGADVIKVEDTGDGDYMRHFPPTVDTDGGAINPAFVAANRGKRSIALDLKRSEAREVVLALAQRADALIESFRPGVLARLGLDWERLHALNSRLVLCSLSGYGQTGPLAQKAGHDLNYIAMTGVLDQTRNEHAVAIPNLQVGDLLGGSLSALSALLMALLAAQRTGVGCRIDVAMTDALLAHHFFPHMELDAGQAPAAGHTLLTGGVACYRVYQAADSRELAVGALEFKFWRAVCETIGLPDLIDRHWSRGEAPGTAAARDTIERVQARLRERSAADWLARFEGVDACVTAVLTPAEARDHPHHHARGIVHRSNHVTHMAPLAQMSADALPADAFEPRPAPSQGQHTTELLAELGYGQQQIANLIESGAARQA